jgi:hypothetical protein
MGALVRIHRWLGVAFCLFFAMWFATGIVMHFVPFPSLTEAERAAGLLPFDPSAVRHGPAAAVSASRIPDAARVRLFARNDGLVYVVQGESGMSAVLASDLTPAAVQSPASAVSYAADHARQRHLDAGSARLRELASHDQWSVPNGLDLHRPLYRIALNDSAGTELYVSSATGEVVRDTTRFERAWNYAGSVAHWIYPTVLRRNWAAWDAAVWWLSLIALIAAMAGAVLGVLRVQLLQGRIVSAYRGWHAWHHWLGLGCMIFVLTWIFSGWLSMDNGRLFSSGKLSLGEASRFANAPAWEKASSSGLLPQALEVEWFVFDGDIYRRERTGLSSQRLTRTGGERGAKRAFLEPGGINSVAKRLLPSCSPAIAVAPSDDYAISSTMPGAPVYRVVCADTWFHIDGANGAVLEKLDPSRRAYRWFYTALHTLDFPAIAAHPTLRTTAIVLPCALGLAFSMTAIVIGWRRLRS